MRTDWQAYDDGGLAPEEKAVADDLLRNSPDAARELGGLRDLRRAVRAAALREPVPVKRLYKSLAAVAGRRPDRLPILRPAFLVLALVAAIVFAIVSNYDPNPYDLPATKRERFSSPTAAQEWAEKETGLDLMFVDLAPLGKITAAHTNGASACFDFDVDAKIVHVQIARAKFSPKGCKTVPTGDGNILVHEKSETIYINCGEFGFIVYGTDAQTEIAIGKALLRNCPTEGS